MSNVQNVGSNNGAGASTLSVSIASTTATNLLLCSFIYGVGVTVSSVKDGSGNSFTQAFAPIESTSLAVFGVQYYILSNAGAQTSVVITLSASAPINAIVSEESGGFN